MKRQMTLLLALLFVTAAMAQNSKEARMSEIRSAYAQAKKKIERNGKGGQSPKDMTIYFSHLDDEDVPLYNEESIDYYFDETPTSDGPVKQLYFIVENWTCHGHMSYQEMLIDPKSQQLMFYFVRAETDGGYAVESRYYYDTAGKCIEAKHSTDNTWTDDGSAKEDAEFYVKYFNMATRAGGFPTLAPDPSGHATTPKAQRIKQIRALYAQAKDKIAKNEKKDMPNHLGIILHDSGDDMPPRTTTTSMYFDSACYFISEHISSMSFDAYSEYLFDPEGKSLIFSYTRVKEEGEQLEWRYYYDENGKCIETKSNTEETDDGQEDKRTAKELQAFFNSLMK